MRALRLVADRKLELAEVPDPSPPGAGEVQVRIKAVALNHLDLWGYRGMAFVKRQLPLVVGAEAAGEIHRIEPQAFETLWKREQNPNPAIHRQGQQVNLRFAELLTFVPVQPRPLRLAFEVESDFHEQPAGAPGPAPTGRV
jgi:hypothetical protein